MKKLFAMALVALFVASTSSLVLAQGSATPVAAPAKTMKKSSKKHTKKHTKKMKKTAAASSTPSAK